MPHSKKQRPSSTAGRSKGQNCQRSHGKNIYSKDPRAYRTKPEIYMAACMEVDKMKGNRMSTNN